MALGRGSGAWCELAGRNVRQAASVGLGNAWQKPDGLAVAKGLQGQACSGLPSGSAEFHLNLMEKIRPRRIPLRVTFYSLVSADQAALVLRAGLEAAFQDRLFCRSSAWPQPAAEPRVVEIAVQVPGSNWEHYRCYPTDLPQGDYYRIPLPALAQSTVALRSTAD